MNPISLGAPSQTALSSEVGSSPASNFAQYTLDLCARIAAHTDVPGTITHTFLSPATKAVHALLRAEMEALGMAVRTDSAGNLRGLYPATEPTLSSFREAEEPASVLLLGSHIDTVPDSGAYDGILGVALPIALLKSLNGRRLPYAIEIVAFCEEEGVRFKLPFIGSRALIGTLDAETLARTDADCISIAQAIRDFGLDPASLDDARLTAGTFAFLEVHIEQGPLLASHKRSLGIVEAISGQTRLELTFTGQANHAGTTPMGFRTDALTAAAHWIFNVESYAQMTDGLVATVGTIQVTRGAPNIVPGEVVLSLDVRHANDQIRERSVRKLRRKADEIARYRCKGVPGSDSVNFIEVKGRKTSEQTSVVMDEPLRQTLASAVEATGTDFLRMPSGAGHDAMILAPHLPTAMLFLRTPRGLSHHPEEAVLCEDIQAALDACVRFLDTLQPTNPAARVS